MCTCFFNIMCVDEYNDLKVINANFPRFPIEGKIKSISPPLLRGRKRRGEDRASWTALQYWPFQSLDPQGFSFIAPGEKWHKLEPLVRRVYFESTLTTRVYSNYKSEPATQPTNNVPAATLKPSMYGESSLS